MVELNFKQFFEAEDIRNWLLGRPEREDRVSLVPPVSATPESLLGALERAEQQGDMRAIAKAKAEIEKHGYNVKIMRQLTPKFQRRKAAK